MLFNSLTYLLFMALAVPLVIFSPPIVRRVALVAGSLLFYAFWRIDFTVLVVFSAVVDYVASLNIARSAKPRARTAWLVVSLCVNLGLLVFFKYTYFLLDTGAGLLGAMGVVSDFDARRTFGIILPLGISFYTFQTISYTIDVYRGQQAPLRDFVSFLTFVMFWPQLVAGPVLRAHEVVPQIQNPRRPHVGDIVHGLEEILQGLFKKVVLADGVLYSGYSIAGIVDEGFNHIAADALGPLDVWTLSFAFGLQIYFDFSGYSQIAIGSARIMGFHFPRNFDWPYFAASPRDFWQRWHISLSAWIRDYLYLPLMGAKFRGASTGGIDPKAPPSRTPVSALRRTWALFATWFIMGLWHGAAWTFALWGLWHAVMVFGHRISEPLRVKLPMLLRTTGGWVLTLSLAMLSWILFREQNLGEGMTMLARAFDVTRILPIRQNMALREDQYLLVAVYFLGLLAVAGLVKLHRHVTVPAAVRYAAITVGNAVMIFTVILCLRQVDQFIYFQF